MEHALRLIAINLIFVSACQTQLNIAQLPTMMILPSLTRTATIQPSQTLPPTWTPTDTPSPTSSPTHTPSATPSATITDTPTITPSPTTTPSPTPMGDARVIGEKGVNLRAGPSTRFTPALALLITDTELVLTGRTANNRWYEVRTFDGRAGWAFGDLLDMRIDPNMLAITWFETPTPIPLIVGDPSTDNVARVSGTISQRVRQIYRDGLRRGNQPDVFSKVGDSITANQPFLGTFNPGKYELGSYAYLQATIDYFRPSIGRASLAASKAFNAAAVLSDLWADPFNCEPNESPLECEYRHNRPSIAIIMLGSVDIQLYTADEFGLFLSEIVQTTINQGIVPVLTTFPNGHDFYWEESVEFNTIIRQIAAREQLPLIELRTPALALPDNGVQEDKFHLTQSEDDYIELDQDKHLYALTLRDLLTMQMLDTIRRGVN